MLKSSSTSLIDSTVDRLFSVEHDAHIWILDRDVATLALRWVQPGPCHYAEQCWRLVAARGNGVCAISGCPVKKGDLVYRPDARPPASNAKVTILKDVVPRIGVIVRANLAVAARKAACSKAWLLDSFRAISDFASS
jgi:hypothetical protein